jgi:hypothetical protein
MFFPLQPLELWAPFKARWVWAGAAAIFFLATCRLQFVRQGRQHRYAAAAGEEQLGICSARQGKYYWLYVHYGKLTLALYFRRN